ncbi:glycosyltransferase family 2 protein [Actinoplanes sp. NPDC051494]|uniref:glycosyltransferase family 2 protein n=1 Tax=Actinoplanes sp. NPDC051494 TaxID=3363907 RepID=UPI0037B4ED3F
MTPISIVVPTLNEQKYIGRLLGSLERQTSAPPFEVLVVDCSDDDLTFEAVLRHRGSLDLTYERSPVKDIGTQRNTGAAHAEHELLLFLDADVTLTPGVLRECAAASEDRLFVGAILHKADIDTFGTRAGLVLIYALLLVARVFGFGVTNGDFLLTNRATFDKIGGFREGYLLGEDTDLGVRARRAGAGYAFISREHVVASSRRLTQMSAGSLIAIWSRAFIRAVLRGPTPRSSDIKYPFGSWT